VSRFRAGLRQHFALVAILVAAVGLRCAYLPANVGVVDQSAPQAEVARSILIGHWFAENTVASELVTSKMEQAHRVVDPAEVNYAPAEAHPHWQPFLNEVAGPGLVLAGVWGLTGSERLVYGKVLQIAIDLLMLLLVYRIVMLLFARRRAALIAAALYAVCPPIARQTAIFEPDIWGLYFTIAILALYLEAIRSPERRRWLVACGLVTGLGAYFRPNVVLLPMALGLASMGWPEVQRPLRRALTITALSALVLVPWTIRNYVEVHRFIPIRGGSGMTLAAGLGETHNSFGAVDSDLGNYTQVHRERPDLIYKSIPYDEYLRSRSLREIEQHPLYYAKLVGRRILLSTAALYESAWMYNGGESPFRYRTRTGGGLLSYVVNRPFELIESGFESALMVLAMLTVIFTRRRFRHEHLLLIAVVLTALVPYWLIHFEARYALPTLPIYLIWIALGADLLGERARSLRVRRVLFDYRANSRLGNKTIQRDLISG
jgi:4-amino-4-deoxy-L-arabinose transferase-like glycosyltransferase